AKHRDHEFRHEDDRAARVAWRDLDHPSSDRRVVTMGWPSRLTYQQIAATGIRRSLRVLAAYRDIDTATALLESDPSLADDPESLAEAAARGHDDIIRLMLRHRPR